MYEFLRIQYRLGVIEADQVREFAPKWITSEQAETIVKGGGAA